MEKQPLKRGAWSAEEDVKLTAYIRRYGIWNWNQMPRFAGLSRSGKSCRLRWMNYLRPDVKLGKFTKEEDETIVKMHELLGNRWSEIARKLPGRTDNEIKNQWHTRLKKRILLQKNMVNPLAKAKAGEISKPSEEEATDNNSQGSNAAEIVDDDRIRSSDLLHTSLPGSMVEDSDLMFWTQPFLIENSTVEDLQSGLGVGDSQFDDLGTPEVSSFDNDVFCDLLFDFPEIEDVLSYV